MTPHGTSKAFVYLAKGMPLAQVLAPAARGVRQRVVVVVVVVELAQRVVVVVELAQRVVVVVVVVMVAVAVVVRVVRVVPQQPPLVLAAACSYGRFCPRLSGQWCAALSVAAQP